MKIDKTSFHKILITIWILFQSFLVIYSGLHTDLEAAKYTYQANSLLTTGGFSAPKYLFYSTLILIIAVFVKLGASYWFVVIFQTLLNGFATLILYKLAKQISGSLKVAQITTLLFITFYPLQIWNVYLYTESLFFSFAILFTYTVYNYPPFTVRNFFINIPILLLLVLTRPFGLLFILPFFVHAIMISKYFFRNILIGTSVLGLISMLILINYAFNGGEDMDAMKPFKEEHTICFIPNTKPETIQTVQTSNPVYDIFYYIANNPIHFLKLMLLRLASFFDLSRPYYSSLHNIYLRMMIIPTYSLALIGLIFNKKGLNQKGLNFIILTIVFYTIGTTFQCDDYHSRFIMTLFPFIFILSANGLYYLSEIHKRNKNLVAN